MRVRSHRVNHFGFISTHFIELNIRKQMKNVSTICYPKKLDCSDKHQLETPFLAHRLLTKQYCELLFCGSQGSVGDAL
jgi:hypothetical protein